MQSYFVILAIAFLFSIVPSTFSFELIELNNSISPSVLKNEECDIGECKGKRCSCCPGYDREPITNSCQKCDRGECKGSVCKCCPGYGPDWFSKSCISCDDRSECKEKKCRCCPGYGIHFDFGQRKCERCNCNGEVETCVIFEIRNKEETFCICKYGFATVNRNECRIPCSDDKQCLNGGSCSKRGLCSCPFGTRGPFCEEVYNCKVADCGTEAKCVYNAANESVKCQCNVEETAFDPVTKKCKITCNEDRNCLNGGLCTGNGSLKTCSCLSGTEGPFCERIPACKQLNCGNESKCVYDAQKKTVKCMCNVERMTYDPTDRQCKNLTLLDISEDNFFVNFFLHKNKSLGNSTKFDFKFGLKDVSNQSKNRIFVHINSESLVPLSIYKCSLIKCQHGGKCEIKNETAICTCPDNYTGDYCEKDKCLPIKCQNGGECHIKKGKAVCVCNDRYLGKSCEIDKCNLINCLNGGKCDFRNGKAVCICKEKFVGDFCEQEIGEALPITNTVMK